MARLNLQENLVSPPTPAAGFASIYFKSDNVLYIKDSSGVETAIGTASGITQLIGEGTAIGPGVATLTLSNDAVISKILTGFVAGPDSPVLATDSILQAIQKLQAQVDTSTASAITALTGDVSAFGPGSVAATVNSVGGSSASNIHSAELLANAATSANTVNTIVKRDGSGNITVTSVTGHLIGNADTSTTSTNFTGALSGDVTGTQSATVVSKIQGTAITGTTGTGNVVLSDSPTLTGTITAVAANFSGAITASNLSGSTSGTNTGDVTVTDTDSIHLILAAQNISANLKLSSDAADASNLKATVSVHSGAGAGLHVEYPFATPVQIGTSNNIGAASSFSLSDHVHAHGNQTSPTLHALVTSSANGFMSSADKVKLDAATALNTASSLVLRDSSGNFAAGTITANLIGNVTGNVSGSSGTFTGTLAGDVTGTQSATVIAVGAVTDTKASLSNKPAVTVVATTNQTLSGLPTIDGQATTATSVILLTAQTTGSQNGPWQAASGAWTRPTWYPSGGTTQAFQFITTLVRLGATYRGTTWRMITSGVITIDTTTTTWVVTPIALNPNTIDGSKITATYLNRVITLTDAANIATDASLGNTFIVTLGGNRNLSAPTNPVDGQKITYRIKQDATGGRGLTFDPIFSFGLDLAPLIPSSGANKTDYMGCIYNADNVSWNVVAISKGF